MAGKPLVQAVQEAIYQVRWVDAFGKDGKIATDEAIAEAVVEALDKAEEMEYAVQVHQDDPDRWVVVGRILAYGEEPYWGPKVTMEEHIERQREYWTDRTFRMVKRVKAGRIQDV